jgi:hypothetical protein
MKVGIFKFVEVCIGDSYGRNDCLVNDGLDTMVEIYDTRYGQFVSRYYAFTIKTMSDNEGLDIGDGWSMDKNEVKKLREFTYSLA